MPYPPTAGIGLCVVLNLDTDCGLNVQSVLADVGRSARYWCGEFCIRWWVDIGLRCSVSNGQAWLIDAHALVYTAHISVLISVYDAPCCIDLKMNIAPSLLAQSTSPALVGYAHWRRIGVGIMRETSAYATVYTLGIDA